MADSKQEKLHWLFIAGIALTGPGVVFAAALGKKTELFWAGVFILALAGVLMFIGAMKTKKQS